MGTVIRQATINALLSYLGIALGFLNVVVLYPKVLQTEEFGLTRLMLSVATMAAQVAQLGAENTIIRYFPYFRDRERAHRGMLSGILLFALATGLISMALLWLGHPWLTEVFADRNALYGQLGLLVLPLVFSEIVFILLRSYSRALHRTVQPTFLREFVLRIGQSGLIAWQAFDPMPFRQFLLLYVGVFLITTVALAADLWGRGHLVLGWRHRWWPGRLRRSMMLYSGFTLSASLAGMVLGNMDQLMIGALLGRDALTAVAHYAVAFYFGSVIATPGRALAQAAVPHLADAWRRRDHAAITSMYERSSFMMLLVSGLCYLLIWAASDVFFAFLPPDYTHAARISLIIGMAYLLTSSIGLSVGIISMSKAYRLDAWSSLSMLVINVVANFLLVRSMGIEGAAWATLLSLASVNAYRTWFLWKRYRLWPWSRRTGWGMTAICGAVLAMWLLPSSGSLWSDMALRLVVAAGVMLPFLVLTGVVEELRSMVRRD
jgi:O-antigen/teichoic acid export membrane protein